MQSWKFKKIEKILAGAPESRRVERESQNFFSSFLNFQLCIEIFFDATKRNFLGVYKILVNKSVKTGRLLKEEISASAKCSTVWYRTVKIIYS